MFEINKNKNVDLNYGVKEGRVPQIPREGRRNWPADQSARRPLWGTRETRQRYWVHQEEPWGAHRHRRRAATGWKWTAQEAEARVWEKNRGPSKWIRAGESQAVVSID